jgi:predicted hotdog family 3-hydroxylacyl-ACP dehydratase
MQEGIMMEPVDAYMDILELIPQRPPVVMVSALVSVEGNSATTLLRLQEDNLFLKNGLFSESGLVEHIAQSIAAMNGYAARARSEAVRTGYIGAVKNLKIHALPEVGTTLKTHVREEASALNASIIRGEVRQDGRLVAECEMKVFLQDP